MRPLSALTGLLVLFASVAHAGEGERTYPNPSCTDRNSSGADCVIQDGPPRRSAFGANSPPVKQPTQPAQNPPGGTSTGSGVTILPGGSSSGSGR